MGSSECDVVAVYGNWGFVWRRRAVIFWLRLRLLKSEEASCILIRRDYGMKGQDWDIFVTWSVYKRGRLARFANSFHPVHAICVTIHRMAIQILTRRLFLLQNARVCAPYCLWCRMFTDLLLAAEGVTSHYAVFLFPSLLLAKTKLVHTSARALFVGEG